MKHNHHWILRVGRKGTTNGKRFQYVKMTCAEYDAYYASGWKFFPSKRWWLFAWKAEA